MGMDKKNILSLVYLFTLIIHENMVATRPWNPWNPWKTQNVLECPWKSWNLPEFTQMSLNCPWIVLEFHLAVISKNVVSKFHLTFKFHNFLQPWWRNGIYFGDKLSHSGLFQMVKLQNFLQPWWRNWIYFGDKLSHSGLFQMVKFHNFLQPWRRNGIYFGAFWTVSDG